ELGIFVDDDRKRIPTGVVGPGIRDIHARQDDIISEGRFLADKVQPEHVIPIGKQSVGHADAHPSISLRIDHEAEARCELRPTALRESVTCTILHVAGEERSRGRVNVNRAVYVLRERRLIEMEELAVLAIYLIERLPADAVIYREPRADFPSVLN